MRASNFASLLWDCIEFRPPMLYILYGIPLHFRCMHVGEFFELLLHPDFNISSPGCRTHSWMIGSRGWWKAQDTSPQEYLLFQSHNISEPVFLNQYDLCLIHLLILFHQYFCLFEELV